MNKKIIWCYYWVSYIVINGLKGLGKTYGGRFGERDFLQPGQVNDYIRERLLDNNPLMVCRIGANESFTLRTYEFQHAKNEEKALEQLCSCAGFFPNEKEYAFRFLNLMKEILAITDLCGVLRCPLDDYFIRNYTGSKCQTMMLYSVDPIVYDIPWTLSLKGKNVLVIHPFTDSIKKQYLKREQLFPDKEVLPNFNLLTIKAVQTSAGMKDNRFNSWFEALDYMKREIGKLDFDVALLGCGAYGMPLAAHIKQLGKQAIHIGGGLQILFGIKGKRWDNNSNINCYYNDAWVYPSSEETPQFAELVEGACYWGNE